MPSYIDDPSDERPEGQRRRKRKPKPLQRLRCKATSKATGNPCRAWAIIGGTVCRKHGGSAPQTIAKARERYLEFLMPALTELHKVLLQTDVADANKMRAIRDIVERTLGPVRQHMDIEVQQKWDDTFEGAVWGEDDAETEVEQLRAEVSRLKALNARRAQPELPAGRPPAVDDRPSGPIEGRVLDDDEEWPPRRA